MCCIRCKVISFFIPVTCTTTKRTMLGSVPRQVKVVLHQQGQLSFSHRKKYNPSPGHLHRWMTTRRTTCCWSSTMEIRLKWCSCLLNRQSLRARRLHQQLSLNLHSASLG